MQVESDDREVAAQIRKIEEILKKGGARFHPGVQVRCRDKGLSLHLLSPCSTDKEIIRIPEYMLVDANALHVQETSDGFSIDPDRSVLSKVQIELGKRMVEIFNLCSKAEEHASNYPWLSFRKSRGLFEKLLTARTRDFGFENQLRVFSDSPAPSDTSDLFSLSFLSTRVTGNIFRREAGSKAFLMPIAEFLNHSHGASPYMRPKLKSGRSVLRLLSYQSIVESTECLAHYGNYDSLDTLLSHGFIYEQAPFVRSVPFEFDLSGIGRIRVDSCHGFVTSSKVHPELASLRDFVPDGNEDSDGVLNLTQLMIPVVHREHGLRTILGVVLRAFSGKNLSERAVNRHILSIERQVVERNIEFYRDLRDFAMEDPDAKECHRHEIGELANLQLIKLYKYRYL